MWKSLMLGAILACGAAAQEGGDVVWRFELDTPIAGGELAVGPDATIYATDNTQLYAINPDGSLKWTSPGHGAGSPISFLDDGTIIVGHAVWVWALDPADGSVIWEYTFTSIDLHEQIEVGPSVGPDGNIYGVTDIKLAENSGLGMFSLTGDGEFRWSDKGDPTLDNINASNHGPMYFTSDHVYFPFAYTSDSGPFVFGYDFDGDQTLGLGGAFSSVPRVDTLERLVLANQSGIRAFNPESEETEWEVDFNGIHLIPAIGASGDVYTGKFLNQLSAIDLDGSIRWTTDHSPDPTKVVGANEAAGKVMYARPGFGDPVMLSAVETSDGAPAWAAPLMQVGINSELVESNEAKFSPDDTVVYFTTRFTGLAEPGAVYAVRMTAGGCAADFNGDGALDILDFVAFQNAFTSGDAAADCDGNGAFNILDFVCFQGLFTAGCP